MFYNSNIFGSCIIQILYTGCAKIKKNNSGGKRLSTLRLHLDFRYRGHIIIRHTSRVLINTLPLKNNMSWLLASKANLVHNSFLVYLFLVHLSNSTCFGRLRVVYVPWGCYSFYRGFSGYSFYGWLICLKVYTPFTSSSLIVSNFVLCGTPFLAGFYSRDLFSKCFLWVM